MDAIAYVKTLVPTGSVTTMAIRGKAVITEQFLDAAEAVTRLMSHNRAGYDVYVLGAQFGQVKKEASGMISRLPDNLLSSRVFWTDADAGPKYKYATPEEARDAVGRAIIDLQITRPTFGIMSGHGCRHIWVTDTSVTPTAWARDANRLYDLFTGAGVTLDKQGTTEIQRGIRLLGSKNLKDSAAPIEVSAFYKGRSVPYAEFRSSLYTTDELSQYVSQDDLRANTKGAKLQYRIENIGDNCPLLAHTLATKGAEDSEPQWMLMLQLLACAEDGKEWIHKVSEGHSEYTPYETEQKYQQRFHPDGEARSGPPYCSTLARVQCDTCPHRGKISTPAHLGRVIREGRLPPGYSSSPEGTFRVFLDEGEKQISATQFLDASLARLQIDGAAEHKGGQLVMRIQFLTPGGKSKECILPTEALSSGQSYRRVLLAEGVNATYSGPYDPLKEMMGSWLEHLQRTQRKESVVERIGWVNNKKGDIEGFALPDRIYRQGRTIPGEQPQVDSGLHQVYHTKGTLEAWREGAQAVINGGDSALALPIAGSLAAPLMRFTNIAGSVVSLSSAMSGSGKTTALMAGAGVWGDPLRSVFLADDTSNSVLGRIGRAPCMPVYWDEVFTHWSHDAAKEMISTIFRLAQGREKSRMRASREIMPGAQWQTLIVVASNYRLMDAVRSLKDQSAANLTRIIEVPVSQIRKPSTDVDLLRDNYGHAGLLYAKWLSVNAEKIAENIRAHQHHMLDKYFRGDVQARFWAATLACLDAGAQYANLLGLIRIDRNKIIETIMNAIDQQFMAHAKEQLINPADIVMNYLSSIREHINAFWWNNGKDMSNGIGHSIQPLLGKPVYAFHYVDRCEWHIAVQFLRQWLTKRSYNTTEVFEELLRTPGCTQTTALFGERSFYESGRQKFIRIDTTAKEFKQAGLHRLGIRQKGM